MKSTTSRNLPALANLVALEATVRKGSVTEAADELCLTQSAVSKQLTELENFLGVRLLDRRKGGVVATATGAEYLKRVTQVLNLLEEATLEVLTGRGSGGRLDLSVPVSLGNIWLLPRMLQFAKQHPQIQLNITTKVGPVDLPHSGLDAAIMYCGGPPPGHFGVEVMPLELFPVCAPDRLPRGGSLAQALRQLPLLHQHTALDAWPAYLAQIGAKVARPGDGPRYGLLTMGLQAAVSGMGIALLPEFVAGDDLRAGRLIRLSDISYLSPKSYYFVCLDEKRANPTLVTFLDWLLQTAKADAHRPRHRLTPARPT
ncbi:LysR substrate-binding domain-containing protein [Cupriavidus gilardii]|uniref:LysR substrate-binding domain-containing protein n=1 Tax=Cupriavidus gilardii TaxID=82541 RepID=UPI0009ECC988|nr:LysR substrate-binding domain-containing protein [Cupriavidus gilardii]